MVQQSGQITVLNPVLLRKKNQGVARGIEKQPRLEIRNKPERSRFQMLETPTLKNIWSIPDLNFEFVLVSVRQDFRDSDFGFRPDKSQDSYRSLEKTRPALFGTFQVGISRWTQEVA
jgi:hypothetical protein